MRGNVRAPNRAGWTRKRSTRRQTPFPRGHRTAALGDRTPAPVSSGEKQDRIGQGRRRAAAGLTTAGIDAPLRGRSVLRRPDRQHPSRASLDGRRAEGRARSGRLGWRGSLPALTGSVAGPQLLLRLYQSSFEVASRQTGYSFQEVVSAIFLAFRERADELGEGFQEAVLHDAISGEAAQQDSRAFSPGRRRRGTT